MKTPASPYSEGVKAALQGKPSYINPYSCAHEVSRAAYDRGYRDEMNRQHTSTFTELPATVFREVPKTSRKGRMSDDRVLFFLRAAHLQDYRYVNVLKDTFGLTGPNIDKLLSIASPRAGNGVDAHGVHIICRPSQFTRFLIRRNEAGKQNQFKELNPSIFYPALSGTPGNWDVDVSRNPA